MHRFFVPPDWVRDQFVKLEGDVARQISNVLRMSTGDEISLLDNSGKEHRVRIKGFGKGFVDGEVLVTQECQGEPTAKIILYQALLKGEKFEWVLQKCTELGVSEFAPIISQRSIPQQRAERQTTRYQRWSMIIAEAAEQSGRCLLPGLRNPASFKEACDGIDEGDVSLIPWEREDSTQLRSLIRGEGSEHVRIFIGPEGGFEESEVAYARAHGVRPVSLGKRILRSETAAIATVTAVMYESGEMGR